MKKRAVLKKPFFTVLCILCAGFLAAQTGDAAVARRYVERAQTEYAAGRTAEALAVLERGADYGAASSDLLFILARLGNLLGRSRFSVLEICRRALETNRWEGLVFDGVSSGPEEARLLEARLLTELRLFDAALETLGRCDPERYETQYRRLEALRGLPEEGEFFNALERIFTRFPRRTEPVRLLFVYASRKDPSDRLRSLVDLALRRLPVLIEGDPELAYLAVPFMRDSEEARRYTASYRAALSTPNPASLPAALYLGLVDGKAAVDELFTPGKTGLTLDRELIVRTGELLGTGDERNYLAGKLLRFSGLITEDRDNDGIAEARTLYRDGMILEYSYDADQDGETDMLITFVRGLPDRADIVLGSPPRRALLRWEQYPAVLNTRVDDILYIPRPLDYFFTPLRFAPLVPGGPDYPELEEPPVLTVRSLLSFAAVMEQPSAEFPGAVEQIELVSGIPVKATVYWEGRPALKREYRQGLPLVEYVDMDLDGRLETIRRYDERGLVSSESDWDGDGIYEYAEIRQDDGTMKQWDLNRDGIRETGVKTTR